MIIIILFLKDFDLYKPSLLSVNKVYKSILQFLVSELNI